MIKSRLQIVSTFDGDKHIDREVVYFCNSTKDLRLTCPCGKSKGICLPTEPSKGHPGYDKSKVWHVLDKVQLTIAPSVKMRHNMACKCHFTIKNGTVKIHKDPQK